MKKNLTKKLMLSVLTLAFAVVSLGASTFAWFTTSKDAKVEQVKTEVIGGSGIEIGVAKIGDTAPDAYYVNELKSDKIKALFAGSTYPVLNNITALKTGSELVFGEALYDEYGTEVDLDYTNSNLGYIAFRLFVKVNAAGTLTLGTLNVTSSSSTNWNAGVAYTNGLEQPVSATGYEKFSVTNAARVAVVAQQKNTDGYATVANYVYEEAAAGTDAKTGNSTGCSNLGAYQIYNKKQNDESKKLPLFKGDTVTKLNWTDAKTFGDELTDDAISITVARDEVVIYDVYLWIEGYDAECVNAIFAHDVKLDIKFNWVA